MSKRTTFTMDDAVADMLQERVARTGKSLSSVINEVLRNSLEESSPKRRFEVKAFALGIDDTRLPSEILAELELEEDLERLSVVEEATSRELSTPKLRSVRRYIVSSSAKKRKRVKK